MPRARFVEPEAPPAVEFITSGSLLLDLILGGGWAVGRVANIVGDASSGKTLLVIEACANFAQRWAPGNIRYAESEAAFDVAYAESLGMPKGIRLSSEEETTTLRTVEDWHNDLKAFLKDADEGPKLYALDSFDGLSDAAELAADFGAASYGTGKARDSSKMLRLVTADVRDAQCAMLVISQTRENIGVTFGEKKTRSGGKALRFYCSQEIWLAETGKIYREWDKVKRPIGVEVLVNNKKNKISLPYRRAEISILFGYGVDDETSNAQWLQDNNGKLPFKNITETKAEIARFRRNQDRDGLLDLARELRDSVKHRWGDIEDAMRPTMRKYQAGG